MNERKYCVYMHKNKINGKVYIGATCLPTIARWGKTGNQYKRQKHFYDDIEKFGWNNFEHIILEEDLNFLESKEKEKYYIEINKSNCYNKTKGGEQSKTKFNTNNEYQENYEIKKNKIVAYCKEHHKEMAKKSREYYYANEDYHKRKIQYQRDYRAKKKLEFANNE